jgi:hypothetical protein
MILSWTFSPHRLVCTKHRGPQKKGHEGPKPGGRLAGPCRSAQHPFALVHAHLFLRYDSVYFLSLPTFLANSKLGIEFRLSFRKGVLPFLWGVSLGVVARFYPSCSS